MCEYIGIDVGKEALDLCWLQEVKPARIKHKKIKNSPSTFSEIAKWLVTKTNVSPHDILVTLESTGVYHEGIVYYLHEQGFQIFLSNPGKAKKFSQALDILHKTDKSDAIMLARFGLSQGSQARRWVPECKETRELKALSRRLAALEKDCHRERNRLEACKIGRSCPRVVKSISGIISILDDEIELLKEGIDDLINSSSTLRKNRELLLSIKGIGAVMARELVYLFSAKSFTTAKQAAAYVGLVPRLNESGTFKGRTTLSKAGPSRIRSKLFLAAVSASNHNPDVRAQRDRLLKSGKTKMQALGAAMRKLIHISFGVIKNQTEYQPQVH